MVARDDTPAIDHLPDLVAALSPRERGLFERLFAVAVAEGETVPPTEMAPWIERTFGSLQAVRRQRVVRIHNRWTFEGAIFNPLRAHRPGSGTTTAASPEGAAALRERIDAAHDDDFCHPLTRTPADTFGRIHGPHVVTSANVAMADGWHGVAIFDRHDPLAIDPPLVDDVLRVGEEWAARAHRDDPEARHMFLLWNALWRAGASLIHGHTQMLLSHHMPQARVELWRAAALRYAQETGGDYFADLIEVHEVLGLGFTSASGVRGFASLTPVKEREAVVFARASVLPNRLGLSALARPLAHVLERANTRMGVRSFNVAVFGPPYGDRTGWDGFPVVARFVDRGNPLSPTSDIGAMELFGSSVVAADPFDVARDLLEERPAGW